MAMMENPNITAATKKKIAARAEKLLSVDTAEQRHIQRCDRVCVGTREFGDKLLYNLRKAFVLEKDRQGMILAMKAAGMYNAPKTGINHAPIKWNVLMQGAGVEGRLRSGNNPFFIKNSYYNNRLKGTPRNHYNSSYTYSKEYGDYELFLEVCKETNIKPMVVIIPVNGRWYDHIGFKKSERQKYYNKVKKIAKSYGAVVDDCSGREYQKYFLEDSIHIGWEGWVKVSEDIYKFAKQN
jgi:D-alanine transfer protein